MNAAPDPARQGTSNGHSSTFEDSLGAFSRLAERDVAPPEYFNEFLRLLLPALAADAGVVWEQPAPGRLQLQAQKGMPPGKLVWNGDTTLDVSRLNAFDHTAPLISPTIDSTTDGNASSPVAFIPVVIDKRTARLLELWFPLDSPHWLDSATMRLARTTAELAATYLRGFERQQLQGQKQLWTQLDAFVRMIHGSLDPTEIAYHVANEGRRLVGCDRCSVAVRRGDKLRVEAISGLDTVEHRSNLVRRMRELCERVLAWGETLEFSGVRDDSLPPDVLAALDAYLAESSCRFLTVLPLLEKREEDGPNPPRTALVMECFDSTSKHRKLVERMRVVGQHACSALYNATEYRTIPLRLLWWPMVRLRQGLGGTTRAIIASVSAAVLLILAMLLWIPYPLKMDATGQLLPEERAWVYAPVEGQVTALAPDVRPGSLVTENQSLILMHDMQLQIRMVQLQSEIAGAQRDIEALSAQADAAASPADQQSIGGERKKREYVLERKVAEIRALCQRTHAVEDRPGLFWVKSPLSGTVLNSDFHETLVHRTVKPSDPLLRVGDKSGRWEVVLKIPQKHLGQVLLAFGSEDPGAELDVDLLLLSAPTRTFRGKLIRGKLGSEATPSKEETNPEPVLTASVRIDGPDLTEAEQIPRALVIAGTEVHAKIRCGKQRMGYSLFYGVWEFFYEKVVFFF